MTQTETKQELTTRQLWIMAGACGLSAANIYYNQPLLGDFAEAFHASAAQAGMVATSSQVGYGIGLLFFLPLGDVVERRKIVLWLTNVCALLMLATAAANSLPWLILAHLGSGITAMSAQLLIPLSIDLTPPEKRGHTVGFMMGGLLAGLLLARTCSGFIGDQFGWRAMYLLAGGIMIALGVVLSATLPHRAPSLKLPYLSLMKSLGTLLREQRGLWTPSLVSGISFGCFLAFWTTLSFYMKDQFDRGATEAGLFGVIGLIGTLGAPLAGKLSDRKGSRFTVTIALLLTVIAFGLMWQWRAIAGLVIAVLLMDLGVQSIQVAEQSTVIGLLPEARNRLNTIYMCTRFMGASIGSLVGAWAWTHWKWDGVCGLGMILLLGGLVLHWFAGPDTHRHLKAEEMDLVE